MDPKKNPDAFDGFDFKDRKPMTHLEKTRSPALRAAIAKRQAEQAGYKQAAE